MDGSVRIGEPIQRNTLVYRSAVEYAGWCANLFQGCSHDCKYCYARSLAKRTGHIKTDDEWPIVRPVGNVLELLDRELPKYAGQIDEVHLCFTCDPFAYAYDPETDDCHEDVAFNAYSGRCRTPFHGKPDTVTLHPGHRNARSRTPLRCEAGRFRPSERNRTERA